MFYSNPRFDKELSSVNYFHCFNQKIFNWPVSSISFIKATRKSEMKYITNRLSEAYIDCRKSWTNWLIGTKVWGKDWWSLSQWDTWWQLPPPGSDWWIFLNSNKACSYWQAKARLLYQTERGTNWISFGKYENDHGAVMVVMACHGLKSLQC